jgi:predicted alpha/beta-fold hydrolase
LIDAVTYKAPPWLPGGNLQTIYPYFFAPRPAVRYRRERWDTPDGDFIDIDWLESSGPDISAAPLVALFHGLEGNSRGYYALSLMDRLVAAGWNGVVINFRGCSGEPNRLVRSYHAGDAEEIDWILTRLKGLAPSRALHAAGVSLGGNALLKWLGTQPERATATVKSAVAVSAPVDLVACGRALDSGFNRLYAAHFLLTLKKKALHKLTLAPGRFDATAIRRARTLYGFDDAYTAPAHGFRNADDYWVRASSRTNLKSIRTPTLLINARNDPFLPARSLPGAAEVSGDVVMEFPEQGGHVGFVSGAFPGTSAWLPERILEFFGTTR